MVYKKRTLQQLFTLMIVEGYYGVDMYNYMCNSLHNALEDGVISAEEEARAIKAINNWLKSLNKVTVADLIREYIPFSDWALSKNTRIVRLGGLDIYSNWANRPRKSRGSLEAVMAKRIIGWNALDK